MTEDQIRELLREMRDEPVPPDSLARVRLGVANRTEQTGWSRMLRAPWSVGAMVLAMGCLLVFAILSLRRPAPITKPAPPVVARQETAPVVNPVPQVNVARKRRRQADPSIKTRPRIENASAAEPPVLIRIETPDPNVVILLIGDGD